MQIQLKEMIERAEIKAGSQKALAEYLHQDAGNIRGAKAGIKGLPHYACVLIAELINENPISVIAASELVTEKKEERLKVWRPFVQGAAGVLMLVVALNMSISPAHAGESRQVADYSVYYVKSRIRKLFKLLGSLAEFLRMHSTTWTRPHCYG